MVRVAGRSGIALSIVLSSSAYEGCRDSSCQETAECAAPIRDAADAGGVVGACDIDAPFEQRTTIPLPHDTNGFGLSASQLIGFITVPIRSSDRSKEVSSEQIHVVERSAPDGVFGEPRLTAIDVVSNQPSLAPDGSWLFFAKDNTGPGAAAARIWSARVAGAVVRDPSEVTSVNDGASSQVSPSVSNKAIYFARTIDSAKILHRLWRSDVVGELFSPPSQIDVGSFSGPYDVDHPAVRADDRVLYVTTRALVTSILFGEPSVRRAQRSAEGSPFGGFDEVASLKNAVDYVSWISPDECVVYGIWHGQLVKLRRGRRSR